MRQPKTPLRVYIIGTSIALLLAGIAIVFVNQPQCPESYTQAQVDASNCIIGANIGLGLLLLLAGFIEVVSILATIVLLIVGRRKA